MRAEVLIIEDERELAELIAMYRTGCPFCLSAVRGFCVASACTPTEKRRAAEIKRHKEGNHRNQGEGMLRTGCPALSGRGIAASSCSVDRPLDAES